MKQLRALFALAAVVLAGGIFAACSDAPTSPAGPKVRAQRTIIVGGDTVSVPVVSSNDDGDAPVVCADSLRRADGTCRNPGSMGSGG